MRFFLPSLTLIFIYLKLSAQIFWPWVWVLSPLWIPVALVLIYLICGALMILGGLTITKGNHETYS